MPEIPPWREGGELLGLIGCTVSPRPSSTTAQMFADLDTKVGVFGGGALVVGGIVV
jgi:hypothetical protein